MKIEAKLAEMAKKSDLAKAVFVTLSNMERSRPTTDLGRFRSRVKEAYGREIEVKEFMAVFKSFQDIGLGKLILSRELSKSPHRFKWAHNNVEVGKAVTSQEEAILPTRLTQQQVPLATHTGPQDEAMALVLSYPLRGRLYSLQLPPDLSKAEAESLAAFIQRMGR